MYCCCCCCSCSWDCHFGCSWDCCCGCSWDCGYGCSWDCCFCGCCFLIQIVVVVNIVPIVVSKVFISTVDAIVDGATVVPGVCTTIIDNNTRVVIPKVPTKVVVIVPSVVSKVFIVIIRSIADGASVVPRVCIPNVDDETRVVIPRITTNIFFYIDIVPMVISKVFISTVDAIADCSTVVPCICSTRVDDNTRIVISRVAWLCPKDIVRGDLTTYYKT